MKKHNLLRRVAAVAVSALLALTGTACSEGINIESTGITLEYPVTVNEMEIGSRPERVVVLSGSIADVVLAMGYETSLCAASEDCTQPELQVLQKLAATDVAAIQAANPQLVLTDHIDDGTKAALEGAGIPVLVLEPAKNREDFERLYSQVGSVLNGSSTGYNNGIKSAQKIFSSLDDLARLVPDSNTVVTACYISDVDNLQAVTGDQLGSVMMSYMGLTNIFKGSANGQYTFEDLKLSNPTMIFCPASQYARITTDEAYAALNAVKTGRVYTIDPHYMDWQGKSVYYGCIDMMGMAYPELTESSTPSVEMNLGTPEPSPTPEPTPEPTPDPLPEPDASQYTDLPSGSEGEAVMTMQARLAELGFLTAEYSGAYGEITKEAVSAFQSANGLEATGEADARTLAYLYDDRAKNTNGEAVPYTPAE